MTSVINSPGQERPRKYVVNIAGVELVIEYELGEGWVVTDKKTGEPVLSVRKARHVLKKKNLAEIRREIARLLCNGDKQCAKQKVEEIPLAEVRRALKEQFISRVAIRRVALSDGMNAVVVHTPAFYVAALNIAGVLVYKTAQMGGEPRVEPRLIIAEYDDNGDMKLRTTPSIHLLEAIAAPMRINNTYVYVRAPAYKEAIAAGDIGMAEEVASELAMEMGFSILGPAWPREERVLYWLDRTKNNPEAWLRWTYLEVISRELNKWVWPKLRGRRLLPLIPAAVTFSPVYDFVLHVVFSGSRGAGKSLHIAAVAALAPYTIRASQATPAVLDRLRTHALCIAFDEFGANEQEVFWYIRTFTKRSVKLLVAPDRKGAVAFVGGWAVLLPDLGQLSERDGSGAAVSRSIVFHLMVDKTMARLDDPIQYLQDEYINKPIYHGVAPDGKEATLYIEDIYALQVALFLRLAGRVYRTYRELSREISAKAKSREVNVEGRRLQAFAPLLVVARLMGSDVETEVWRYLKETSEEAPSQTFLAVIDALRYIMERGEGDPEVREQVRKLELDGERYVFLVKPAAVLDVAAKMVREGATVAVTERARIEEGENAVLKKVELWPRRTLPPELQSVERYERWLARETYYAKHLLGYARDKTRRDRKHLIVTPDVLDLFEAEAWRNLDAAEEIFRRICADVKVLIDTYPNVIHITHPILRECSAYWSGAVERREPLDKDGGGARVERGVEREAESNPPSTNMDLERATAEREGGASAQDSSAAETRSANNNMGVDVSNGENPAPVNAPPPALVTLHLDKCQTEVACSTTALHHGESSGVENNVSNTQVEKEEATGNSTDGERRVIKPENVIQWLKKLTQEWA